VALTVAAARYVAPSGDHPDGVLADVEEDTAEEAVHAYGQLVRAALGPAATMAIVPMDYWHAQPRAYTPAEVYAYVRKSVAEVRARTRPDMPVAVLGQMFTFYPGGTDDNGSPNAAEILAAAAAARSA